MSDTLKQFFGVTQTADLLLTPLESKSLAFKIPTQVRTSGHTFRIPAVRQDPSAAWVAEGEEIPVSAAVGDEVAITPRKVAGLVTVSSETADDTNPAAATMVGDGLARDIARKVDQAFFGAAPTGPAATRQAPGLESLPAGGADGITLVPGGSLTDLEPFIDALAAAEEAGVVISAWVADSDSASTLAKLTTGSGSSVPLLGTDAANGIARTVLGIPLIVSPYVVAGIWGLSAATAVTVLRDDVSIDVDRSAYFSSDMVAIRGRIRVGFGFPNPAGIVKVTKTA